jgi:type II secretory pathway pseudopilin PulG
MAKYKRADSLDDETTYSQEMAKAQPRAEPMPADPNEATYQKRYGDLRRHTQNQLSEKDRQLAEMKAQLDAAAKGQIKFPKTDQEVEMWSKKYPDVANIVDTIARKRANEALEEGEKRLQGLKDLEHKLTRKEAEQRLMKLHPDFNKIRASKDFHEWVALQPTYIQDALYKNNSDAQAAGRAIDLYKSDRGKRTGNFSAAESVGRTNSAAPTATAKGTWRESQVNKLSDDEFEKNQDEIMAAMRSGKFIYDMTGAAR